MGCACEEGDGLDGHEALQDHHRMLAGAIFRLQLSSIADDKGLRGATSALSNVIRALDYNGCSDDGMTGVVIP